MERGEVIKGKTFVIAKVKIDRHNDVVMVDMFDRDYNRMYFHKSQDGRFIFEVFHLYDVLSGETKSEIKTIYDIMKILKQHGVNMTYSAELEGK